MKLSVYNDAVYDYEKDQPFNLTRTDMRKVISEEATAFKREKERNE